MGETSSVTDLTTRRELLARAIDLLHATDDPAEAVTILERHARGIARSQGITVVIRDGDHVVYVSEDAITPLWAGNRFPASQCISGIAINGGQPLLIPDIRQDKRVPLHLYIATFVGRLAIFPIGDVAAVGVYWNTPGPIDTDTVELMSELADAARGVFATHGKPALAF